MELVFSIVEGLTGAIIMALTGIVGIVTFTIVLPIMAFQVSWWWAVLCFVFPGPATLIFSLLHFQRAKIPLAIGILSFFICVGTYILRSFISTFFQVPVP